MIVRSWGKEEKSVKLTFIYRHRGRYERHRSTRAKNLQINYQYMLRKERVKLAARTIPETQPVMTMPETQLVALGCSSC